ncbi:MAG: DUF4982 domain-containing protein, partial [Clostridia bacterium]|nr:DUF4982 domain-containing protein [Clostridia bacterium]
GFDYRGEPNPFITTNVASSFGTIDLCGMEKPPFYYYQAWWSDEPVLKLTPHWNHKEGETVTMAVFTNCEEITLSVNGRVVETRKVERFDAPLFTIPFEAGVIAVEGTKEGRTYRDELRTSGKTAQVRCVPALVGSSDEDVSILQLEAYDKNGNFCPLAAEEVALTIENGQIVGVGNGDPACLDYEQKPVEEEVRELRTFQYEKGLYSVPPKKPNRLFCRLDWIESEEPQPGYEDDFRLVAKYNNHLGDMQTLTFTTTFRDAEAYQYVEFERLYGNVTVYLNGKEIGNNLRTYGRMSSHKERPYRFYCSFAEGENQLTVVSEQENTVLDPIAGYVRLGRRVENTPWKVRLHYGLARVFVKSDVPQQVTITATLC